MERLKVTLEDSEYSALLRLAEEELRGVSDQARHIVRRELAKLGLLETLVSRGAIAGTGRLAREHSDGPPSKRHVDSAVGVLFPEDHDSYVLTPSTTNLRAISTEQPSVGARP